MGTSVGVFVRLLLVALLLVLVGVGCSIPKVSAVPRVAWLYIDGDIAVSDRRGDADASSDADDLGLDTAAVFMPRLEFDWNPIHVSLNGFRASYSGDGEATARLSFEDVTIERGTDVKTDVTLDYLVGTFVYDLLPIETVEVGIGVGAGILGYDLEFDAKGLSEDITLDDSLPFGYLMARVATEIGPVKLLGTVGGITLDLADNDIDYLEFDVSVGVRIFGEESPLEGHVVVGYRYFGLDYTGKSTDGRLDADLTLMGPYLGFDVTF